MGNPEFSQPEPPLNKQQREQQQARNFAEKQGWGGLYDAFADLEQRMDEFPTEKAYKKQVDQVLKAFARGEIDPPQTPQISQQSIKGKKGL